MGSGKSAAAGGKVSDAYGRKGPSRMRGQAAEAERPPKDLLEMLSHAVLGLE